LTTELLKCLPSELANPKTKPQIAVQLATDATVLEENYRLTPTVLGLRPVDLLRVATAPAALAVTAMSFLIVILVAEAAAVEAPHTGPAGEPVAGAIAAAEATQTATPPVSHAAAMMPVAESRKFDATNPQARTTASPPFLLDFAICCSQKNSGLWGSPSMM
jgi:hypothetical protein